MTIAPRTTRSAFLLLLSMIVCFDSAASDRVCLREHEATRLATLRVRTCLLGYPAKEGRTAQATAVRQTLTNVGGKPIELVLQQERLRLGQLFVTKPDGVPAHRFPLPIEADGYVYKANRHVRLTAGKSKTLHYRFKEFLAEAPIAGLRYYVSARTEYDYRFPGETDLDALYKRNEEQLARNEVVPRADFDDVEIGVEGFD
jgi:hypothetical protein